MKMKYCTTFLKDRRTLLGLEQQAVAAAIGMTWQAYRQLECRGEIPERHIPQIAIALKVSVLDLLIAKWKPVFETTFGIEGDQVELFIRRHSKK